MSPRITMSMIESLNSFAFLLPQMLCNRVVTSQCAQKVRFAKDKNEQIPMRLNADFDQRIVIRPEDYQWVKSPMAGVERMMLDRVGEESARATSLVRYAPSSEFSTHTHTGGEEFFVLEGVFADEHQSYPKGSYVRNPVGTTHTPKVGPEGAVIFVKLQQFNPNDTQQLAINTQNQPWLNGMVDGLKVLPLHSFETEHIALVKWAPNTHFPAHQHWGGEEILVLDGTFYDEHGCYPKGTWLRSPHLSKHSPFTRSDGALIYVKTGHL